MEIPAQPSYGVSLGSIKRWRDKENKCGFYTSMKKNEIMLFSEKCIEWRSAC
jgi:hypothetical protein